MHWVDAALTLVAAFVAGVTVLTLAGTFHFFRRRPVPSEAEVRAAFPGGVPFVSVLKPCKGADPGLYDNLASFLGLTGVPHEVLIGVADEADPAAEVARQLMHAFPDRPVRLVVTGDRHGVNPKVHILSALTREAKGELLLVSDSNTRARGPELLRQVCLELADPRVGAGVGLIVAQPGVSLSSRLEAARFNSTVTPALASAFHVFGVGNGFGKCMVVRRAALDTLGGWDAYLRYLTEDGLIARDMRRAGMRVVVMPTLVDVLVGEMTLPWLWRHELRWTTGHRIGYPLVPIGEMLWNPWFLLGVAGVGSALGGDPLPVLATIALRFLAEALLLFKFGRSLGSAWLLPLMDAGMACITVAAYLRRDVVWRGQRFVLGKDTLILQVEPATLAVVPSAEPASVASAPESP